MQKIRKILRAIFKNTALPTNQPNIAVSDFGLIWRRFCEYLQINNFFKYPAVTFLPLQSPNFLQNIRKILRAVSEKTVLPTNYYQQHRFFRTSLTPVQKDKNRYL